MARATEWRRYSQSYLNDQAAGVRHEVLVCPLFPGETLARIRWMYRAIQVPADPFGPQGVIWNLGWQVYSGALGVPDRFPVTNMDDEWVWWEGFTMRNEYAFVRSDGTDSSLSSGPVDGLVRDSKAMRVNRTAETENVWFQTQAPGDAGDGNHYVSLSASVLILLAP